MVDMAVDVFNLYNLAVFFLIFLLGLSVTFCTILFITSKNDDEVVRFPEERTFVDPRTNDSTKFPSLNECATLNLSVIVPAFNEQERLPIMLDECVAFLESKRKETGSFTYEVIVVDDGSSDDTTATALKYSGKYGTDKCRVLTLIKNRGKGGAVRLGVYSSRGKWLLFADADGATKFGEIDKLLLSMTCMVEDPEKERAIVVGSRAHLEKESIAQRSAFRTFLMHGFHFLVWFFCVRRVRDTQCGFKLFTRAAARACFSNLHIQRWAFDVELLYISEALKIKTDEVAVTWTEIPGSKLTPIWSWLEMGRDLISIWLRYKIGAWRIRHHYAIST